MSYIIDNRRILSKVHINNYATNASIHVFYVIWCVAIAMIIVLWCLGSSLTSFVVKVSNKLGLYLRLHSLSSTCRVDSPDWLRPPGHMTRRSRMQRGPVGTLQSEQRAAAKRPPWCSPFRLVRGRSLHFALRKTLPLTKVLKMKEYITSVCLLFNSDRKASQNTYDSYRGLLTAINSLASNGHFGSYSVIEGMSLIKDLVQIYRPPLSIAKLKAKISIEGFHLY